MAKTAVTSGLCCTFCSQPAPDINGQDAAREAMRQGWEWFIVRGERRFACPECLSHQAQASGPQG